MQRTVSARLAAGCPRGSPAWSIAVASALTATLLALAPHASGTAQSVRPEAVPIKERHLGASRDAANKQPRSEKDQTVVDGWPLYRNERGQAAFNDAMAVLKSTDSPAPSPTVFKDCEKLECRVSLPAIDSTGWIPQGRLWVSTSEYLLFVHSPRRSGQQNYKRRSNRSMQYFVYHEFHNSSRNTDAYDTAASHRGSIFVPFYMTRQDTDAKGRRFVVVLQVAPYDVYSIHATNLGSAGPGIEVAKNAHDAMQPLQGLAGILVATIVKAAAPRLEVVNHRGDEGLPMLEAYERRLSLLRSRRAPQTTALPFVPAMPARVASASARLDELIARATPAGRPTATNAEIVPPRPRLVWQRN